MDWLRRRLQGKGAHIALTMMITAEEGSRTLLNEASAREHWQSLGDSPPERESKCVTRGADSLRHRTQKKRGIVASTMLCTVGKVEDSGLWSECVRGSMVGI